MQSVHVMRVENVCFGLLGTRSHSTACELLTPMEHPKHQRGCCDEKQTDVASSNGPVRLNETVGSIYS